MDITQLSEFTAFMLFVSIVFTGLVVLIVPDRTPMCNCPACRGIKKARNGT